MKKDILFETINNEKLELESNEQLLKLIKDILKKYKLSHSEIIVNYFIDKNLLKIFELNRKRYKFTRESYLSNLSLTYLLVYFDSLLETLEKIHKSQSISKCFLDKYFEEENKLAYFCSDLSGNVFHKYAELSESEIVRRNYLLLIDDFLTGLNKMKLYYNIYFGKVSNKYIMNYKTDKDTVILQKFIYKISKSLNDNEIIFIYNLRKKDIEHLTKEESKIFKNIIEKFNKKDSNIIVKPNFIIEEDKRLLDQIPLFLQSNNHKINFNNFENSNIVIGKEAIEICTFDGIIGRNTYYCKIRKIYGSLYLYLFDGRDSIFRDRIYSLEDLNRFIIIIEEQNRIKENEFNFWN